MIDQKQISSAVFKTRNPLAVKIETIAVTGTLQPGMMLPTAPSNDSGVLALTI